MANARAMKSRQPEQYLKAQPTLVQKVLQGLLVFRPAPPGDALGNKCPGLILTRKTVEVDASERELTSVQKRLQGGALTISEVRRIAKTAALAPAFAKKLIDATSTAGPSSWEDPIGAAHELDNLAGLAVTIVNRAQESLLKLEPLTEIHFHFTDAARAVLAVGWEAMAKRGLFPIPPLGGTRIKDLQKNPCGAMHFVSASDIDSGYFYTMGIALSP